MQSSEFSKYFNCFPSIQDYFKGVYSIDTLPNNLGVFNYCICNTSPSNTTGEHWFCIVKTSTNHVEIFDSLGVSYDKLESLKKYINFRLKNLTFNTSIFQHSSSDACGKFCIYFIIQRLHNLDLSYNDILDDIFSTDLEENDLRVNNFCFSILNTI